MALTPINIGSSENDGTGQTLRSAFATVNSNESDLQAQIDTKSPIGHTHTINQISGLTAALNTLQTNINQVYVNIDVNDFAGTDVYDLINGLNDQITAQNAMIIQQNVTIQSLSQIINNILEEINL